MAGNQTQRFDAVLQLSEAAVNDVLSTFFDSGGLLSDFLQGVGLGSAEGLFSLDALFDRPADVAIPAAAQNIIDLRFDIGEGGNLGQIRAVAGLKVDRNQSDQFDITVIDFENELYFTGFLAGSVPIPVLPDLFAQFLRDDVRAAPVMAVPVKRDASDPADLPVRADTRVIDSPNGEDALAIMLTFADGTPGTAAALENFVAPGDSGAMAIFFRWLARILRPRIAGALAVDEEVFDVGDDFLRLNQSITAPEDGSATIDTLELRLRDDFIRLRCEISQSGFCYEASGEITGRIRAAIDDGELIFSAEVDEPEVDLDIPWYCYLGAALVGALTGGIAGALIGAGVGAIAGTVVGGVVGGAIVGGIVGAILIGILVPLLLAIVENVLEPTIEGVAGSLAESLGQDLSVPAIGLNLIFQRASIDDFALHFDAEPVERVPIRASGYVELRDGEFLDLDNGRTGPPGLDGADLHWTERGFARVLRPRCGARLARTGRRSFSGVLRWRLYPLVYNVPAIPLSELATLIPLPGFVGGTQYIETKLVFGVRTDEGRFAVVQVAEIFDDRIRIRFRTYDKRLPDVQLVGGFACASWWVPGLSTGERSDVRFVPTRRSGIKSDIADGVKQRELRLGSWLATLRRRRSQTGNFRAVTSGFIAPLEYRWSVGGTELMVSQGNVEVDGRNATYIVDGERLTLTFRSTDEFEFSLRVTALDAAGKSATATECVRFGGICSRAVRVIPPAIAAIATSHEHFGVVHAAVPPKK